MKMIRLFNLLSIIMVAVLSMGLNACGGSDDDDRSPTEVPRDIIGQWYNISNTTYSMNFVFKNDGTGTGEISHNRIISISTFAFSYTYSSNGDITCVGKRAMVDEENAETVDTRLVFHYDKSTKRLTLTDGDNGNWHGAVFEKTGVDYSGIDNGESEDTGTNTPSTIPTGIYYTLEANGYHTCIMELLEMGNWRKAKEIAAGSTECYYFTEYAAIAVTSGDKFKWLYLQTSSTRVPSDAILVDTQYYSYQTNRFTAYYYLYADNYYSDSWMDMSEDFTYSNGVLKYKSGMYSGAILKKIK